MFNLGVGYLDMGLYEDTENIFGKATEINPSYDKHTIILPFLCTSRGKVDETIKEL